MPIRVLDAATVGRIAAGEVVERPGSVVKELIENSLDAGATSITVEIRGGGIDYLRVTDNGCGIEPGQVRLAFENHATSKLQRAEQLDDIRTLGFRGEALPSIAAVSRVEMTTRAKDQPSGMRYSSEGGQNIRIQEAGCPQGTTIIMRDLFFNVPVRRAFLKKPSYEGGLVSDAAARLLLGNPNVSMRFISGGNTLYHSFGDGKLRHAVFAVYGRETAEKMAELDAAEGGVRISGLIGVGELAKATRAHQLFYINGRSVRCPLLSRALEQVCRSRVTIGMYPMCVLNLTLPPTAVDVNVHPNKLEVRFRDEDMMRTTCEALLSRAFEGERVLEIEKLAQDTPALARRSTVREIPLEGAKPSAQPNEGVSAPETATTRPEAAPETPVRQTAAPVTVPPRRAEHAARPEQLRLGFAPSGAQLLREDALADLDSRPLKIMTSGTTAQRRSAEAVTEAPLSQTPAPQNPAAEAPVEAAQEKSAPKNPEPSAPEPIQFRLIGVAFKTYILAEAGDKLLLIDQHAAHERLQYEKLMRRAQAGEASQELLVPLVLHLSAREIAAIEENMAALEEAGYRIEPFGAQDIRVLAVPFVMGKAEIRPIFLEMLQSLGQLKAATVDVRRSEIMQMACKSAVKGGDALTQSEIEALISQMTATGAPPTCPHGRPVVKVISKRELEKMFKRIQ